MSTTVVKCQAKNPATCKFHGTPVAVDDSVLTDLKKLYDDAILKAKNTNQNTVFPISPPGKLVEHALKAPLQWTGEKPSWWEQHVNDSPSGKIFHGKPELVDVIDSPEGKLAVVWEPFSTDRTDDTQASESGIKVSNLNFYAFEDKNKRWGQLKLATYDDECFKESFGDDEFTPFRWLSRYDGQSLGLTDYEGAQHFGYRNLSEEETIKKRREVWKRYYSGVVGGYRSPSKGYIAGYNLKDEDVPSDDVVKADLNKFAETINSRIVEKDKFYTHAYVDYSEIEYELKGQGYGSAAYIYASRMMGASGKIFRGSGVQSEEAGHVWSKFKKTLPKYYNESTSIDGDAELVTHSFLDFRKKK